jgi:hypothetical protein
MALALSGSNGAEECAWTISTSRPSCGDRWSRATSSDVLRARSGRAAAGEIVAESHVGLRHDVQVMKLEEHRPCMQGMHASR